MEFSVGYYCSYYYYGAVNDGFFKMTSEFLMRSEQNIVRLAAVAEVFVEILADCYAAR